MQKNDSRCRGMIAGVEEEQVQKRRNSRCRGEEAGAKKELVLGVLCGGNWFASSWYHTDWSMISAPSCLLSAVRLVAPHSLQVLHIDTQRCNISWKVSQVSHYIEPYLEFEARRRLLGHSWEVRNGQASASTPSCSGVYPFLFLHAGVTLIQPGPPTWLLSACLAHAFTAWGHIWLHIYVVPRVKAASETWQPLFHILIAACSLAARDGVVVVVRNDGD